MMVKEKKPTDFGTIEIGPENSARKATLVQTDGKKELTANYVGKVNIMGLELGCAVLSNEQRVFFQREVVYALTGTRKGDIKRYFSAENLQPFVPEKFKGEKWDENVIKFKYGPDISNGYEATDVIDICNMYIQARNAGVLLKSQIQLAKASDVVVNAFAKTGVIAVIDEATGYQIHRKKDALRLLVESYIIEEARKWMKEFPDEFFIELDRMYDRKTSSPNKRPQHYGNFINKYIYDPIEHGYVLDKLRELNPVTENGYRRKRFFQYLNEPLGLQVLRQRIGKITALLQISPNKRKFDSNFQRMEGKNKQLELFDTEEYETE